MNKQIEGQTTIFQMLYPEFHITKKIRLIELFGGGWEHRLRLWSD